MTNSGSGMLMVPVAIGELIDKITILQIKQERISDPEKRANIAYELELLTRIRNESVPNSPTLVALGDELKSVNQAIWNLEDDIRDKERHGVFDQRFIDLARAVYRTNDQRAAVKRRINLEAGSAIVEEKSYAAY